jgi:hypothetical protein
VHVWSAVRRGQGRGQTDRQIIAAGSVVEGREERYGPTD